MRKIILLDHELANQIAAGEVVERPASVVKELVENSIDAGATHVEVFVSEAGRQKITVIDNGSGIPQDELELAFARHATSKIYAAFDLFRIKTLGFRGEALPSIASVSKVQIETATKDGSGVSATIIGGEFRMQSSAANVGTKITVEELFYNTPARLKFLKQDYTENAVILDVLTRIALANPAISVSLYFDDKLRFKTTGRNDLKETILNIYGLNYVKNIVPITFSTNDFTVSGFLGNTNLVRANRYGMITNLNGRNVYMPKINAAITEAYHGFIAPTRYPFVILNMTIEPELVDVNVHPTKKEVRFSKEDGLKDALLHEIPRALRTDEFIPKTVYTHDEESSFTNSKKHYEAPTQVTFTFNEEGNERELPISEQPFVPTLDLTERLTKHTLTNVFPIAALHQTYIICETLDGGFWLIDQHAAHERINYEKFQKVLNENLVTRPLLVPELFTFSHSEMELFTSEALRTLKEVGLEVEHFGANTIRVKSVPNYTGEYNENVYIANIIDEVITTKKLNPEHLRSNAIATMACKASIKAKHRLSLSEMEHLVNTLLNAENPYSCPHGRPTIIKFSKYELEKLFKRTGT